MAHLLIIELPGGNDCDIIQAALDRGDSFTFLSAQLAHYQQQAPIATLLTRARQQLEISPFDYDQVEQCVVDIHLREPVHAVICLLDTRLTEAARLATRLGLPCLNPDSAQLLRDKFNTRQQLASKGMPQMPFALATTNAEVREAVGQLGLPLIIKPADGYGSQNIVVLRYAEDLDPLLSPIDELLPSHTDYGLGVKANDRLLIERFIDGTIIGCDTLTINGQHQLLGIHEKVFYPQPSFTIRGGCFIPNNPAFLAIQDYLFSLLDAVNFNCGATHTELMLTEHGPQLIEINPRLVGAKLPRLVSHALGYSVHAALIALHCGQAAASPDTPTLIGVSRWIVTEHAGSLAQVHLPAWHDERIRSVDIFKQAGDWVKPPFDNADRIGAVLVCATSRAEAEQLAERYVADCRVELRHPRDNACL